MSITWLIFLSRMFFNVFYVPSLWCFIQLIYLSFKTIATGVFYRWGYCVKKSWMTCTKLQRYLFWSWDSNPSNLSLLMFEMLHCLSITWKSMLRFIYLTCIYFLYLGPFKLFSVTGNAAPIETSLCTSLILFS